MQTVVRPSSSVGLPRRPHFHSPVSSRMGLSDSLENKCTINRSQSAVMIVRDEGRPTDDEKGAEAGRRSSLVVRRSAPATSF